MTPTRIPGCFEIAPFLQRDERGRFVKTFQEEEFAGAGLATSWREEYCTLSRRGVIRGLHFQRPPHEHAKVVCCVAGEVQDAVVDLRVGSPTYGEFQAFELAGDRGSTLYIPPGLAHGFSVRSEEAILLYKVTTLYSQAHDAGILWSSAGIPWDNANPILSARDRSFPPLAAFESPFRYEPGPAG